jgi:tetratricopeptide (TPR) repeat protein
MYKGRGRSFERFELHDSVKSAIKANNKRTMRLHHSSHHDNPKISTIHTQMIEYYQIHRLEKNINKDLEICYHSMLLRKDFERDFDKDREEFVELVFGSLSLNNDDKNNICKNFDGFISEQISELISGFYKGRDAWLNMMSPQLYSRLKLETERGMEDVLKDIRFLISLTKERAFKNDSSLYYLIGKIYYEKDEYDKAIEFYSQAINLNPKDDNAYNNMGIAYANLKEYDKAITAFQKAIELNPKYDIAYNNMGLAYNGLKEYDKAITAYQKAIEINPKDDEAYYNIGNAYYNLKGYDNAITAYQKAIEINPKRYEAYYNMGIAYSNLKEYNKAITAFQKAIEINPKKYEAYYNMGLTYDKLKEYDKAITAFQKALENMPDGERKAKLTEAIEVFKAHKRY